MNNTEEFASLENLIDIISSNDDWLTSPPEPTERIVGTLDDEEDGNFSNNDLSLREALTIANSGDTITFDPSLSGYKIILNSGELTIDKDLTIKGPGAGNLTIDANNVSQVFNVDDGSSNLIDVTIAGLTITGGNARERGGGGINNQENLTLNKVTITGNTADFDGGGILTNDGASTTINYSTISGNTAGDDGGGISHDHATMTMINYSTISGNTAGDDGGGISNNSFPSPLVVNNSTISGNSANSNGGGIYSIGSSVDISNSTIAHNSADIDGSGVFLDFFADGTITSSIIADNKETADFSGTDYSAGSGGNNLISSISSSLSLPSGVSDTFVNGVKQDIVGTADNPLPTQLEDLQDNGGLTLTHALLPNSKAIATGSNLLGLTTDQRGIERSIGHTDIGALESQMGTVINEIDGSDGDDVITTSGNDIIHGGDGNDILNGMMGNDTLLGGGQFDRLHGGTGDDVLDGGQGVEVLTGGAGSDLFYLDDLDNIAWVMDFELGSDSLGLSEGMSFSDLEITGEVNSFISHEGNRFAVLLGVNSADLDSQAFTTATGMSESQAGTVINEIDGTDGNDVITASRNDIIRGGNGKDILNGMTGNDTLLGGQQFDRLNGGAGDDVLDGGQGVEVLTGGTGSDLFYLDDLDNTAWVMDFELGSDSLGLSEGMSFSDLEITGEVNSFISHEGDRFAVLLGVNSADLDSQAFTTI